jgi:uncharacterized protein YdeI (YjbR/CyaY-like superfamily)
VLELVKRSDKKIAVSDMTQILFKNRAEWRQWLAQNHATEKEIWLEYYKKGSGKTSISYDEAVEEALCWGWIDSLVHKLDAERYMQRYTPRKTDSIWSESNKCRVEKAIAQNCMTSFGLEKIEIARENGSWMQLDKIDRALVIPADLAVALSRDTVAKKNFEKLAPSYKKQYVWWIESAKRLETRERRINETVTRVKAGQVSWVNRSLVH